MRLSLRMTFAALLLLPALAAAAGRASTPPPALELGETRPIDTKLGNPELPSAGSVWVDMIDHARGTLDIEEFYFSHRRGEALQPVFDALGRASARGVSIRLLIDANMGRTYPQWADSLATLPNVLVRRIDYRRLAGGVQHAKFFVVDGSEAWLGSQNLDWRSLSHIHEMGIRVRDPRLATAIRSIFLSDWAAADTTQPFVVGLPSGATWPLRVTQAPGRDVEVWLGASPKGTTPAGTPWDRDLIVQRLAAARQSVTVQVLQYGVRQRGGADSTLHRALIAAAARGVKVRLVVSDWALGGNNEPALRDLAAHGVAVKISRVPEWKGGYIPFARVEHCKYMTVDGEWLWIGTSNWEPSYFFETRNIGLTIHDPVLTKQALKAFESSWSAPTAAAWGPDTQLPPRVHAEKAPPGEAFYGE